jgi:hypothetical protein
MTETAREPVARGRLATAWAIPPVYAAGALGLAILLDLAGAAAASRFWYVSAVVLVPVVLWLAFLLTQPRGDAAGWAVVAWVVAAAPVQLVLAWVLSAPGQGFGCRRPVDLRGGAPGAPVGLRRLGFRRRRHVPGRLGALTLAEVRHGHADQA